MDIHSKYEVLESIREGAVQTFRARQIAGGREVLVHVTNADNARVIEAVRLLPPEKRFHLIEQSLDSGKLVFVTDSSVGTGVEEWLGLATADRFARTGK